MQTTNETVSVPQVEAPAPMWTKFTKLVAGRNIELVRRKIEAKYGFLPSEKYCKDFIKFLDEMIAGGQSTA